MFSIHLFSKAAWMINSPVTKEDLMSLKKEINSNLDEAINAVDKLTEVGFENEVYAYDIGFSHPDITSELEARNEIAKTGLDPDMFDFDILWEGEDDITVECDCCGQEICPHCGKNLEDEENDSEGDVSFGLR